MAEQIVNYKCTACGGPLHFSGTSGKLECEYCLSSFSVEEIEAEYKAREEKAAKAKESQPAEGWGEDAKNMKSYTCPSCGAELVCDQNTAATQCPYCGNQSVVPGQFADSLKPDYIIPFRKEKKDATEALKNHYKGKRLLPKDFVDGNHIEEIQGVYVPFWLFDASADADMTFEATTSTKKRSGDKEITSTKHYDVHRSGTIAFEKIPTDASSRMPDEHMDSIEPYDYKDLKPFSSAYLPGFLADKYDVAKEDCIDRFKERCTTSAREAVKNTVTGYDTVSVQKEQIQVKQKDVHYALMPVWMLSTRWNDQNYLFAMNGQTGRLVGDLPVSMAKFWTWFAGIALPLILIMNLLNMFVLGTPFQGATAFIACEVVPVVIATLVCLSLKAQMKSVGKQSAGFYITDKGLTLRDKQDRYTRTTESVRVIDKK